MVLMLIVAYEHDAYMFGPEDGEKGIEGLKEKLKEKDWKGELTGEGFDYSSAALPQDRNSRIRSVLTLCVEPLSLGMESGATPTCRECSFQSLVIRRQTPRRVNWPIC